jgi:hypothetical protein
VHQIHWHNTVTLNVGLLLIERTRIRINSPYSSFEIDLTLSRFFQSLSQISDDETSNEARKEWESAQDPSRKIMPPWTFSIKFPYDTEFTFESLMFTAGEDENL